MWIRVKFKSIKINLIFNKINFKLVGWQQEIKKIYFLAKPTSSIVFIRHFTETSSSYFLFLKFHFEGCHLCI